MDVKSLALSTAGGLFWRFGESGLALYPRLHVFAIGITSERLHDDQLQGNDDGHAGNTWGLLGLRTASNITRASKVT